MGGNSIITGFGAFGFDMYFFCVLKQPLDLSAPFCVAPQVSLRWGMRVFMKDVFERMCINHTSFSVDSQDS